jgi:hypothetical protein
LPDEWATLLMAGPPCSGAMLTRRAHEEFLLTSGIVRDIRAAGRGAAWRVAEIRSKHASCPVEGELNQALCELLIGLNAKRAVVLSAALLKGSVSSIPEVRDAVRDARREPRGLERQIAAVARDEDPVGQEDGRWYVLSAGSSRR